MSKAPLFWRDATAENDFYAAHGLDSSADFPPDRDPSSRRLQSAELLLLGSISLPCLRAVDLSREPAGHRSLPALALLPALPIGDSRRGVAQHPGPRQRASALADVRRSGRASHRQSPASLRGRYVWRRAGSNGLRPRRHDGRSLPERVSLGAVSLDQGSD